VITDGDSAGQRIRLPVPSVVAYSVFFRSGGHLPTTLSSEHLRSLAAHGAKARLLELESERAAISAAFPDLAGAAGKRSQAAALSDSRKSAARFLLKADAGSRRRRGRDGPH
jgi:hypothetical protein